MAAQVDNDEPKRPKGMRINSRLLGLLIVPLAVLIVVTGIGVVQGISQSNQASELSDRTALASGAYALVDALEVERTTLVAESTSTPEQRAGVQAAADALSARAERVGGPLQQETEAVLRRIRGVELLSVGGIGGRSALRSYSVTIEELLDLSTRAIDPSGAVDGNAAATTDYLARAQAASAQELDLVTVLEAEGEIDAVSFQELSSLAASQRAYSALAAQTAPTDLSIRIREVAFAISAADETRREAFVATVTPSFDPWLESLGTRTAALTDLRSVSEGAAVATVNELSESSRILLLTATFAMIAILLISALLLRRANRSIARPLQDLARQAEDVAEHRLPEAVQAQHHVGDGPPVHLPAIRAAGAAEVHEVAAAFNDVQNTALRLAGEQAALRVNQSEAMTNLGRRNQTLLARQLDFITSLETRETDPEFLEHLFKLDHLASRMRRNAESLLILAGSETPRRRRSPAPVAEVVRAAMSEVEEFERVRIGSLSGATVSGPAVIDLVHLLAELIENALNFSPPDTTVEIDGRTLGQGGYQFAVIDHGVGMTDVELLSANHRIRGLDELEGMPTRYLGQYVVAKLAGKTGAMVTLQKSAGGRGVTALVNLPATALVGPRERGVAGQPLPGSRAARDAGPAPFAPGAGLSTAVPAELPPDASADRVDLTADHAMDVPAAPTDGVDPPSDDDGEPDVLPVVDEASATTDDWGSVTTPSDPVEEPSLSPVESPSIESSPAPAEWVEAASREFGQDPTDPVATDQDPDDPDVTDQEPADQDQADPDVTDQEPADPDVDASVEVDADAPVMGAFASAPSYLPDAHENSGDQDPWAAFRDEDPVEESSPMQESASSGSASPPSPPSPPPPPPPPPPVPAAPAGWWPMDQAPAADVSPLDGGRPGGLARRVPGATLAQQRSDEDELSAPVSDRSADRVRSMLSSFQAGRSRGRGSAPGTTPLPADGDQGVLDASAATTTIHDPNQSTDPAAPSDGSDAHHGRSPQ